jgi:hypothetical protein
MSRTEESYATQANPLGLATVVSAVTLLGLTADFLVDWAWFSTVGYLSVDWTILGGKALLFLAVFVVSTVLLWVNGCLAHRFASASRSPPRDHAGIGRCANPSRAVGPYTAASPVASRHPISR